ncbi:MAG: TetR/AcrR family transcriptional regulator [Cyclobacteriaceae bacterium]
MDERQNQILKEAYRLFAEKGTAQTCMEEIAKNLHISKKTIYSIFRTKNELIKATCAWKMQLIAGRVGAVVDMDIPVVEKMVKYLEVLFDNLLDVTFQIAEEITALKYELSDTMEDYLKNAVFGRFIRLFNQAKEEGRLNEDLDPGATMLKYWELLSTVLVTQPANKIPLVVVGSTSIADLVIKHIIEIYKSLLNETGLKEFNQLQTGHPKLSRFS